MHVFVNDDKGQTWSYSADATADASGGFAVSFQLPTTFIASYSVSATGASGTATTSFTDGNVVLQLATTDNAANGVANFTWSANWTQWQGTGQNPNSNCSGTGSAHTTNYTVNAVDAGGQNTAPQANNNASVQVTGAQPRGSFTTQYVFAYWSSSANSTQPVTPACLAGASGQGTLATFFAHFRNTDSTPPVITPVVTPASPNGSNGWYESGNITVSFTVTDPDSPITSRSAACATDATTTTVSTDGTTGVTCSATSSGGTSTNTQTIKRDTTNPTVALDSLPSSTTSSEVNVSGTATDVTSGVSGVTVNGAAAIFSASIFLRLSVPLSCGPNTISAVSTDNAGNSSTAATASVTRICDTTPPTIGFSQSPDGTGGWFKTSPATVHVTATDASGVASLDCKLDGSAVSLSNTASTATTRSGDVTTSANGDHLVSCQAVDSSPAANTAAYADNQTHLKLDVTSPSITPTVTGTLGLNDWYVSDLTVTWTVADPDSGIASSTGCGSTTISSDTAGTNATCSATNGAGLSASNFVTIKRDTTKPMIALRPAGNGCDVAGDHGWCRGTQTAGFTATDLTSGFAPSGDLSVDFTQSSAVNGASVMIPSGTKTDLAGNVADSVNAGLFKIDSVAPSLATRPAGDGCSDPGLHGWCKGTQTAGFRAMDATSGFDAGGSSPLDFTKSTTTNGGSVTIPSGSVTDWAGNTTASMDSAPFMIDSVAPAIAHNTSADDCSVPGDHGWCRGTQTAGFSATDATSGFGANGTAPFDFTKDTTTNGSAVSIASGAVQDYAGNEASSIDAGPFKIDSVAPSVARNAAADVCSLPGDNGWCRGTQTAGFRATDGTSGFDASATSPFDFTKDTTTNGSDVSIASGAVKDYAGNETSSIDAGLFKIDSVKPVISLRSAGDSCTVPGNSGWCRSTQIAGFKADDATSGFDPSGDLSINFTKNTSTNGSAVQINSGTQTDRAGNIADAVDAGLYMIDSVSPTIGDLGPTPSSPDGNNGWYITAVSNAFEASDATSGPSATCIANFPLASGHYRQSKTTTGDGPAKTVTSDGCTDVAGNSVAGKTSASFKIDLTDPTVTCPAPPTFLLSQLPGTVTASVTDSPSGPAASSVSGSANNPGGGTVSLTGHDLAGRSKTVECAYHVGNTTFNAPVDKAPTMNIAKLGRVVPVKVSLTYDGGAVTGTGTVYVGGQSQVDCATGVGSDTIDVYAAAGSSNTGNLFRWDSTGSFWIYNFDTSAFAMKAGNCYRINVYYGGTVSNGVGSGGALVGYFLMQATK